MLMLNQLIGFGAQPVLSAAPPVWTRIGEATSTANATSYNFGNFNAPTAGLMIVRCVATGANNVTLNSISIGGTNGALYETNPSSSNFRWGIAAREVASGNQNVTVVFSGNAGGRACVVSVGVLTGYQSAIPYDTFGLTNATGSTGVFTYDAPADAVALFGMQSGGSRSWSWSSAAEEYDAVTNFRGASFAAKTGLVAGTGLTETATQSAASDGRWGVCGIWR